MTVNNRIWKTAVCAVLLSGLLCGCTVSVQTEGSTPEAAIEEPVQTAETSSSAIAEETVSSTESSSETAAEAKLKDLILLHKEEYAALSEDQRARITEKWSQNDFRFEDANGIVSVYSGDLDRDAAVLLLIWNEKACMDYVLENYQGDKTYSEQLERTFDESLDAIVALWAEELLDDEFESRLQDLLWDTYWATATIGSTEELEAGTTYIAQGVFGYSEARGAEDAEAFFQMIDGA